MSMVVATVRAERTPNVLAMARVKENE